MAITHRINFRYTTAMTSQWIIMQFCSNDVRKFCIYKAKKNVSKDKNGIATCDKKIPMVWGFK